MNMRRASKPLVSAALAVLMLTTVASCSLPGILTDRPSNGSNNEEESDKSAEALEAYAQLERDQIPLILEQNPGVYKEVVIEGAVLGSATDDFEAGTSVMTYTYVYASPMDWVAGGAALDGQRPTLDNVCNTAIFPSMHSRGVEGTLGAVFAYEDETTAESPDWTHACIE